MIDIYAFLGAWLDCGPEMKVTLPSKLKQTEAALGVIAEQTLTPKFGLVSGKFLVFPEGLV